MNENEVTIEEARLALGEKSNARGYRTFAKAAKVTAVMFALKRIEAGASAGQIADELGLKGWTLQRWLQRHRQDGGRRLEGFHEVRVQAATTKKVVVHGACGVSVDGLTVDDVAQLLRELSCSV